MSNDARHDLIDLTQTLLNAIARNDWITYAELCDPSLTAFEGEARGHLVEGLDFHRFYFETGEAQRVQSTISSPHVRMLSEEAAVVSYIRLVQRLDASGGAETLRFEETRVWQKIDDAWRNVHFHRSAND